MTAEPFDWDAPLALDRRLKWALAAAVLPFVALTAELPVLWAQFRECGFELYGVMFVSLGFVAVREWLFKLFSPLMYVCFLAYQYDFFMDPTHAWNDPAQSRFWIAAVFAAICFGFNLWHGFLIARLKRQPWSESLQNLVGRPLAGAALRREIEIQKAAAEAQANQAWVAQAGRQE